MTGNDRHSKQRESGIEDLVQPEEELTADQVESVVGGLTAGGFNSSKGEPDSSLLAQKVRYEIRS